MCRGGDGGAGMGGEGGARRVGRDPHPKPYTENTRARYRDDVTLYREYARAHTYTHIYAHTHTHTGGAKYTSSRAPVVKTCCAGDEHTHTHTYTHTQGTHSSNKTTNAGEE